MKKKYFLFLIVGVILIYSCNPESKKDKKETGTEVTTSVVQADPLPSWNDTPVKKKITDFVEAVTKEGGPQFIPVEERIATFDNDGTLWCEQPLYFEVLYSLFATKQIAEKSPELMKKPEIRALVTGDKATFLKSGEKGIVEAFAISHTAMGVDAFNQMTQAWLDTAKHARFGKPYRELTYKPMVELLQYLRNHRFKTYIVSGGSSVFIRNFGEKAYGIPPEQVIGTMLKAEFVPKGESYEVKFTTELWHNDDHNGKPVGIFQIIGRKPVLAFGNSDGDLEMLQWTSTNSHPYLNLLLHHTDAQREYAYDKDSQIGKLDKALTEAQQKGWEVVDMKKDFKKIFSYE